MFNKFSSSIFRRNLAVVSSSLTLLPKFAPIQQINSLLFVQQQSSVLFTPKRWNSSKNSDDDSSNSATKTVHVSDQDLALGNDMPPLLQYNENLVASALRLVEFANQSSEEQQDPNVPPVTPEVEAGIGNIMAMLFHEEYIPLVEQFLAVRELTKLEAIRKNPKLLEAVHDITAALVPDTIVGLLKVVDADFTVYDNDALQDVEHFIVLILEGQENDDEFVRALQTMQNRNPQLDQSTAFIILLQNMNDVLLQARLAHLLTEACLSFDPEKTGNIKVAELKESLEKILPKEAVAKMMERIEGDAKGCVPYSQMARVLLRGKEVEIVGVKE
jgi:hypothetical protein